MARKPAYKELEQRIRGLEKENNSLKEDCIEHQQGFNSAVPFCVIDKNYNMIRVNDSFCSHFLMGKKEVQGRKCFNVWNGPICNTPDCPLAQILDGKNSCEHEVDKELDDGSTLSYLIKTLPYRNSEGETIGVTENFIEITDRKKAEISLRLSEERWHTMLQNMPVMVIAFDTDRKIVIWNKECEHVTGFVADEIIDNVKALELLYPDEGFRKIVADKLTWPVNDYYGWEFDVFCKDESAKTVVWSNMSKSFPIPGCSSWVVGVDVTERTLNEKTLRDREKKLVLQSKELEELNTALKIMLGKEEDNKKELEENVFNNVKRLLFPILEKLLTGSLDHEQREFINILESNLRNLISPFSRKLTTAHIVLTPTELQVANYIREGKTTKEIAALMYSSKRTIDAHRANIRRKLKINSNGTTLKSYLSNLS
jgi:PAS domain S-box-containing protein